MSAGRSDLTDIAGEIRHETEKAYLFFDGSKEVWLAKSQVEWDDEANTMAMQEWLAVEKGLV